MQGLTRYEQRILNSALDHAHARKGFCTETVTLRGYSVMLRHSRPRWPIMLDGKRQWFETLDVVQIGYEKWTHGQCEIADIPKRGASFLFEALEAHCKEKGLALKIECVHADKLRHFFISERGYHHEVFGAHDTSVIKPLSAIAVIKPGDADQD